MKTKKQYIDKITEIVNDRYKDSQYLSAFISLLDKLPLKALIDYYEMLTEYNIFQIYNSIYGTHVWSDSKLGFDYWHKLSYKISNDIYLKNGL